MTDEQKSELRLLTRQGFSFKDIREIVSCSDSTIKEYIKVFAPKPKVKKEPCLNAGEFKKGER